MVSFNRHMLYGPENYSSWNLIYKFRGSRISQGLTRWIRVSEFGTALHFVIHFWVRDESGAARVV